MPIKDNKHRLIISDHYDEKSISNDIRVCLSNSKEGISIPLLMIKWKKELIKEYIAMIYSCGFSKNSRDNNTYKNLLIKPNFSFWWMTLLSEKSPIRSNSIYKIFQFRIVERLFLKYNCQSVVLRSNDKILHNLLLNWSNLSGINYKRERVSFKKKIDIRWAYNKQPNLIKACYFLFNFILKKRHFFGNLSKDKVDSFTDNTAIKRFVISPFPSIDKKKFLTGEFQSHYWGDVQKYICSGVNVNFLFMYTPTKDCKNAKEAIKQRDYLRKHSNGRINYYFLEEWLTYKDFFKILVDYLFLYRRSFKQKNIRENSYIGNSQISYWKTIKPEWLSSTRGVVAIDGCIKMRLFEKCLDSFDNQFDGFYLVENQPWERVFNYLWKKNLNSPLYGVQNVPFRPFDLRFYEDKIVYQSCHESNYPMPDILLTNGEYSKNSILEFGYPANSIMYVEAYKYSYLVNKKNNVPRHYITNKKKTILVVADGLHIFAKNQIKLLGQALGNSEQSDNYTVIVKSHPFCDVSPFIDKYLGNIDYSLTSSSLENLWQKADIVYTSNMTSSSLESLIMGIPTIIYLDYNNINLSPALDCDDAMFASDSISLLEFLNSPKIPELSDRFLCLDSKLTKWKRFLMSIQPLESSL